MRPATCSDTLPSDPRTPANSPAGKQPGLAGALYSMAFTSMIVIFCSLMPGSLLAQSGSLHQGQSAADQWDIEDPAGPVDLLEFEAVEGTWMSLDVSPDGRRILFDLLGHIYEIPVQGGEARPLTGGRSWNLSPRYSPDGSLIAFSSDRDGSHDIWVMNRQGGDLRNISRSDENVFRPFWMPDGEQIVSGMTLYTLQGEGTPLAADRSGMAMPEPGGEGLYLEHRASALYPFSFNPYVVPPGGWRIEYQELVTGHRNTIAGRPGGAFSPAVSPDGNRLAYLNRDNDETILLLQNLPDRTERVLLRGLDPDRQEGGGHAGPWPNIAWHPDGESVYLSSGGRILAVDIDSGESRTVEFRAPVRREITRAPQTVSEVPHGTARTRYQRWATRTPHGILFETLGDLWLKREGSFENLTRSATHETSPVMDPRSGTLYYASWCDDEHGSIRALVPGGTPETVTRVPSQYGSLTLSPDGRTLAYVRGTGDLEQGYPLSNETEFEILLNEDGVEQRLAHISGRELQYANIATKIPPHLRFSPDAETLYFSEFVRDTLVISSIGRDGNGRQILVRFPHATEVSISPDMRWVAFREYHRSFLTPFETARQQEVISAYDGDGFTLRVDSEDGGGFTWIDDGETLGWSRAAAFYEKPVQRIVAEDERNGLTRAQQIAPPEAWRGNRVPGSTAVRSDLAVEYSVAAPASGIALRGVRVITMNPDREEIEGATLLIDGDRIEAVGTDLQIPAGYRIFDLEGHTVMPGIVDAHSHPHIEHSMLHVIEQRPPYLHSALAYGITTMIEVYGTEMRDGWISDMLRAGKITGPRLYTTGSPIYGRRTGRPRLYRPTGTLADAFDQLRWNRDHGAVAIKDYVQMERMRRHHTVRAAREMGMYVLSESASNPQMNLTQLLDGIAGLEHSMALDTFYDDMIRFWQASGAGITPTLGVLYGAPMGEGQFFQREKLWEDEKLTRFIPPSHLMRIRRATRLWEEDIRTAEMARAMHRLHQAGVPVLLGGHGQMMGLDVHWEMEMLAEGGFTPREVLEIATLKGARHHRLDHEIGSIEPGKRADLVVLRDNPLEDIRNSRSIRYVLINGFVHSGDDASRVWPDPQPAQPFYYRLTGR